MEIVTSYDNLTDGNVLVDSVTITYYQNPDCTEDESSESQMLTLSTRNNGVENFMNMKASNWSFDNEEDLVALVKDFKNRAQIV